MRPVLQTISALSLAATILPAMFYLSGALALDEVKWIMLLATAAWFVATPLWMGKKSS